MSNQQNKGEVSEREMLNAILHRLDELGASVKRIEDEIHNNQKQVLDKMNSLVSEVAHIKEGQNKQDELLEKLVTGQERQDKILEALSMRSLEQETEIRELKRI